MARQCVLGRRRPRAAFDPSGGWAHRNREASGSRASICPFTNSSSPGTPARMTAGCDRNGDSMIWRIWRCRMSSMSRISPMSAGSFDRSSGWTRIALQPPPADGTGQQPHLGADDAVGMGTVERLHHEVSAVRVAFPRAGVSACRYQFEERCPCCGRPQVTIQKRWVRLSAPASVESVRSRSASNSTPIGAVAANGPD